MKKLQERELNYWEEKSYMMVIPSEDKLDLLARALRNLEKSDEITIIDQKYNFPNRDITLTILFDSLEYQFSMYVNNDISIAPNYVRSIHFTEEEKMSIIEATTALIIYMSFEGDVKKSYQLQLKLGSIMVPDFIGIMDESAEKMLAKDWVLASIDPKFSLSSKDLYGVQAVMGKKEEIWLHTHGLCRCGLPELEILDSCKEYAMSHLNIMNSLAMYLIDSKCKTDILDSPITIGTFSNGEDISLLCLPWTEGVTYYKKTIAGGLKDRSSSHNTKSRIIFLCFKDKDDLTIQRIDEYNALIADNPLLFYSDEETERMQLLARERFDYVKKAFLKNCKVLIKVALPVGDGEFEHIWFELLELKGKKFKGRLTQESYYADMAVGDEAYYKVDDVTDWIVETEYYDISPSEAFLLDRLKESEDE